MSRKLWAACTDTGIIPTTCARIIKKSMLASRTTDAWVLPKLGTELFILESALRTTGAEATTEMEMTE